MGEGKRKNQVHRYKETTANALEEEAKTEDILTNTKSPSDVILIECELLEGATSPERGDTVRLMDRKVNRVEVILGVDIIGQVSSGGVAVLRRRRARELQSSKGMVMIASVEQPPEFGPTFWVALC